MKRKLTLVFCLIATLTLAHGVAGEETTTEITTTEAEPTTTEAETSTKINEEENKVETDKTKPALKPNTPPLNGFGIRAGPIGVGASSGFAGPLGASNSDGGVGGFYGFGVQTSDGNGNAGASSFAGAASGANGFGGFGGVGGPGGFGFPNGFQGQWGPNGNPNTGFGFPGGWGGFWQQRLPNGEPVGAKDAASPKDPNDATKTIDPKNPDNVNNVGTPKGPSGVHTRFGGENAGVYPGGYPGGYPAGYPAGFGFSGPGAVPKIGTNGVISPKGTAGVSEGEAGVHADTPNVHIIHGSFDGPNSFGSFAGFGSDGFGFPGSFVHWGGPNIPQNSPNGVAVPKDSKVAGVDISVETGEKPNAVDTKTSGSNDPKENALSPNNAPGHGGFGFPGGVGGFGGFSSSGSFAGPNGFGHFGGPNGFGSFGYPPYLAGRFGGYPEDAPNVAGAAASDGVSITATSTNGTDSVASGAASFSGSNGYGGYSAFTGPNGFSGGFGYPGGFGQQGGYGFRSSFGSYGR